MGAGTALAPFQPVRGSGGGTMLTEGPTRQLPPKPPLSARPWPETHDPRKGLASLGFHGRLGREGGGPWT